MDGLLFACVSYSLIFITGFISIWLARSLHWKLNYRCKTALGVIDSKRFGATKGYFIHDVLKKKDFMLGICAWVIIGDVIAFIPIVAHLGTWSEVKATSVLGITVFGGLIFTVLFPLIDSLSTYLRMSRVLIVTDSGFEIWKLKGDNVEFSQTIGWSEIKKFRIYGTNSWGVQSIWMFTGKGRIVVRADGYNILSLLEDLQKYIPEVISKSGIDNLAQLGVMVSILRKKSSLGPVADEIRQK